MEYEHYTGPSGEMVIVSGRRAAMPSGARRCRWVVGWFFSLMPAFCQGAPALWDGIDQLIVEYRWVLALLDRGVRIIIDLQFAPGV
jgi:hypothetical protein